jgi:hypothetical protein
MRKHECCAVLVFVIGVACRVSLAAPPDGVAPPPSVPASSAGASGDGKAGASAYDARCLKEAIKQARKAYQEEAGNFSKASHEASQASHDREKRASEAERKRRNSTTADDNRGRDRNGVSNRDDNFDDRLKYGSNNSGPAKGAEETWDQKMKAEVQAERARDPNSGTHGGQRLLAIDDPLAGKEMDDFVAQYRDKITDARIRGMIAKVKSQYPLELDRMNKGSTTASQPVPSNRPSGAMPTAPSEPSAVKATDEKHADASESKCDTECLRAAIASVKGGYQRQAETCKASKQQAAGGSTARDGAVDASPSAANARAWDEQMKAEVAAERQSNPATGSRSGQPLIPSDDPLAVKEMSDFIREFRDRITDARIKQMIAQVRAEYSKEVAKKKGSSVAASTVHTPS